MSHISDQAVNDRENARMPGGQFGHQGRTGPDLPEQTQQQVMLELSTREMCDDISDSAQLADDELLPSKARSFHTYRSEAMCRGLAWMIAGASNPQADELAFSYLADLGMTRGERVAELAKDGLGQFVASHADTDMRRRAADAMLTEMGHHNQYRDDHSHFGLVDGYSETFLLAWRPSDTSSARRTLANTLDDELRAGRTDPDEIRTALEKSGFTFED